MPTETIPFEILGHFEEIIDIETGKCYGTRPIRYELPKEANDEELKKMASRVFGGCKGLPPVYGYAGRLEKTFKKGDKIMIYKHHKGMQPFRFKADAKCWIITHPICGRVK